MKQKHRVSFYQNIKYEANDKQMLASNDNGVSTYEIVLLWPIMFILSTNENEFIV